MALKIRLQITGKRDSQHYRIVAADENTKRSSKVMILGYVNTQTKPPKIMIDREKLKNYLDKGAIPTEPIRKLLSL